MATRSTRYILTEQARWARDKWDFDYFEMLSDQLAYEASGERKDRGVGVFVRHQAVLVKANVNSAEEWRKDRRYKPLDKRCLQHATDCIRLGEQALFYGLK